MRQPELVIATTNPNKVHEFRDMVGDSFRKVRGTHDREDLDPVPETGDTFRENALMKASGYYDQIGQPVLADDSGLCVDALDGRPGIHSARFAGDDASDEENNRKLIRKLKGVADDRRTARFVCWIVLCVNRETRLMTYGTCSGRILTEPYGDGGFGYDPLFLPDGYVRTFAHMTPEEKNRISHRGRAVQQLQDLLEVSSSDLWQWCDIA